MEGICGYGGSKSQKFEVRVKYVKTNANFAAAILNFPFLALNKYIFRNIDILNQLFDLENVGFDINIMSLGGLEAEIMAKYHFSE